MNGIITFGFYLCMMIFACVSKDYRELGGNAEKRAPGHGSDR